ncbi:hypothetical protein Poli38472_004997 [Pythium oligandrum]|uniref:Uncharacterized protein n=1 Tax=Pythium oligandrum TaxID=41045 RepID=A0A8K1CBG4_PYTOL|nr:hypothetical protein Poli38472_004997 [Pythium oligandrum]|eukprot:TMW59928.1 hypothetical protein Poli38472_004997 [Pythium oligandrum]
MYAKRLRGVFSFRQAIPVLDEYLSSIRIDDDDPGFLFNWLPINVGAFVTAANGLDPAQAPLWLRTPLTTESFINDVIDRLRPVAGGHVEWVLLAPNTPEQFAAIHVRLAMLQAHDFMQDVAQAAFPIVNIGAQYLATTYLLTDTRAQQARPNRLEAITPSGQPLRQLFF